MTSPKSQLLLTSLWTMQELFLSREKQDKKKGKALQNLYLSSNLKVKKDNELLLTYSLNSFCISLILSNPIFYQIE